MAKMIFVNLPVTDLDRSIRFHEAIRCEQNEAFEPRWMDVGAAAASMSPQPVAA
jgi:predicted lactoylglutathione lyase